MGRRRKYTDAQLIRAVTESLSIRAVLKQIGLSPTGANYKGIQARFRELNLDTSHCLGSAHLRGRSHHWSPRRSLREILVAHSSYRNLRSLKRRLLNAGLLLERCAVCRQPPTWRGRRLVLVLDDINGTRDDHRAANLRLLCPNCNSQQRTFAGRNKGRYTRGDRVQERRARYPATG